MCVYDPCTNVCAPAYIQRRTVDVLLYHSLYLILLRQGLSFNLELDWHPACPSAPPDASAHCLGLQVLTMPGFVLFCFNVDVGM